MGQRGAGVGGGAPARPQVSLPLRPRHAAPHVAASRPRRDLARRQRVSCFGPSAGGCRPESSPRRRRRSVGPRHAPWGLAGVFPLASHSLLFLCSENPFVPLCLPSMAPRRRPQRLHGLHHPSTSVAPRRMEETHKGGLKCARAGAGAARAGERLRVRVRVRCRPRARSQGSGASGSSVRPGPPSRQDVGYVRGQRRRLLRPAAACPAQGAKAGRLGCGVHCLASTDSAAAGSGLLAEALVLLPPRRHALARTSSPGPPATMVLSAVLATAAAVLQGALLGHLGSPCRRDPAALGGDSEPPEKGMSEMQERSKQRALQGSEQNRRPQRQKLHVSSTGNLILVNVIIVVGRTVAVVVTVVEATVGVMTVAVWW
ncbi:unnamed protein product [Rangifer tarandus platyrhynchus]|uniref:Uncharacterized protein n=1 Tax=Rangifer tarandus platyrhynchus TaxID=3082113 RepID=A0ABN8Z956_RANTA|nr:unnamed protein product [Rangifer tarandus platyrhynchus]